jgi:N utilization substance protein A
MKGSRIHGIVRELKNENIDVINWTNNINLLIQRSLTPARITSMDIDQESKHASVYLKPDQVSLAIGRRGVNIKLACELTGFEIDVYRDTEGEVDEFDIDLEEFSDEIEPWIIDELKRIGCDTARSVLNLTAEELERRTDLEKETITEIRSVLQSEFEKE